MSKNTSSVDAKAIRESIKRQLQDSHPEFNRLKRKQKRAVVTAFAKQTVAALKSGEPAPRMSQEERIGLDPLPPDIMSLDEMQTYIEDQRRTVLPLRSPSRDAMIQDPLLQVMDELLIDSVLDGLLAPPGMRPGMRDWMPSQLFRIELLRTALFPELSVRKFCTLLEKPEKTKEERAFCNLRTNSKEMCEHSTLSTFRGSLTFAQRVNLMVYMIHLLQASGRLGAQLMHAVDSTDVAEPICSRPLYKIELPDGSFLRFYADLDADCGSRRNKRDKSKMFVGYRVHTLCVIDVKTGISFPLLSLTSAANHHDSQLLEPLLAIAAATGVEIKLLSADEAYADAERQARLLEEDDIRVVTAPKAKVELPEHVDPETQGVFCHGDCEVPMKWNGYDPEDGGHVFTCGDDCGQCFHCPICPRERIIPLDTGCFGPLPSCVDEAQEAIDIRKTAERPFNLLKHMDGLEPCRMKTWSTISAQAVFSQAVGIFKVLAGLRAVPRPDDKPRQEVLPIAANG